MLPRLVSRTVIPGFVPTLGFTILYLVLVVLIPLSGLFAHSMELSWTRFVETVTDERVVHAYQVTFGAACAAALINLVFGLMVTWMLVRYHVPFRRFFDALVDLPFALPTAVAGIALTALYAPKGWIGQYLDPLGIKVAFTPIGIVLAMVFVGLPFVVRTVQPVLEDMEREMEEAAASLGASRWQIFRYVLLPHILPALLTGFSMSFARGLGEYGSVIFIAGNMPGVSEIIPLLIVVKLEQYEYAEATAIALVMLMASFLMLLVVNLLQKWSQTRGFNS